jgi:hypothetical protein
MFRWPDYARRGEVKPRLRISNIARKSLANERKSRLKLKTAAASTALILT